ncbi:MAG TPA: ABC transporter permease subunit [Anaerolineales bacterium]|nr:ABC transporter permease subunit [Anaerolineales bacterium]
MKTSLGARILQYGILIIATLFALYPIWFVILASGRSGDRLLTLNLAGMFIPTEWTFENYRRMIFQELFLTWLRNSFFVAGMTTIACLFIATSAAFAFSRMRFYGREWGLVLFLAIQSFPGVLSLVPIAQLLTAMGLYKNHWGLIMAYVTTTLVFTTMNLKGYFDTIPIDLEEAAMIDGCGPVQSFLLIALPLARPALAVTALFAFMAGWGEYVLASVLIPAPEALQTSMVALYRLANQTTVPWGVFAAGAVMIIIPVLIVFLYLQRFFEGGLTLGGVKG